ncbi:MAG TPA: DUF983 domain-containing protein [Pantanalinema sp.]
MLKAWPRSLMLGLRLRCPRCGKGETSAGLLKPKPFCSACALNFTLNEGEFTGGTYINYGVMALIFVPGFVVIDHFLDWSMEQQLILWGAFALVFPFAFQRNAIGLYTALLYLTGALNHGERASAKDDPEHI